MRKSSASTRSVRSAGPVGEAGAAAGGAPSAGARLVHLHLLVDLVQRLGDRAQVLARGDVGGHLEGLADPVGDVGVVAEQHRHAADPDREGERLPRVPGVAPVAQRGQDVVAVGLHHRQPGHLVPGQQPRRRLGHQGGVVHGVAAEQFGELAPAGQLLRPVLADRLQHPQPGAARLPRRFSRRLPHRLQQRLVHQGRKQIVDVGRIDRWRGRPGRRPARTRADHRDRGGRRPGREDGEALGQQPFLRREQVPAPLHDRAQRAVPRQGGAAAPGEQPEAVVQPPRDLGQRQRPEPGGGQFDRQRQPVQAPDDVDDEGDRLVVDLETGADRGRALGEQPDGREADRLLGGNPGHRLAERRDRQQRFAGDAERLPAGGDDPQPRAVAEQFVRQVRAGVDEVLAVVEHEQGVRVGQAVKQPGSRVAVARPLRRRRAAAEGPAGRSS